MRDPLIRDVLFVAAVLAVLVPLLVIVWVRSVWVLRVALVGAPTTHGRCCSWSVAEVDITRGRRAGLAVTLPKARPSYEHPVKEPEAATRL